VPSLPILTSAIQLAGMRLTPQRMAVCQLLTESDAHPSAAMIYEELCPQFPSLLLATVQNTLETRVNLACISYPLPLDVLGHEGSTILVVLNGLRLLGYQGV
jgi:hypothetical protein